MEPARLAIVSDSMPSSSQEALNTALGTMHGTERLARISGSSTLLPSNWMTSIMLIRFSFSPYSCTWGQSDLISMSRVSPSSCRVAVTNVVFPQVR